MAFDPDKYLAAAPDEPAPEWLAKKAKGFDPDAYLAQPVHSLDSLSADIAKGKAALAKPSGVDRLVSAAKAAPGWLSDTGGESITPSGREGWGKIRAEQAAAGIDPNSREANDPVANDWGAQAIIGGIAGGGAGRAIGPLASKLGPFSRFVTAGTEGAVSNTAQGGDPSTGALIGAGAAFPAVAGEVASSGARAAQTALRNPQREIGRTIRALDEAKASGVINNPAFKALPKGAEGFNQAAGEAEQKLAAHNEQLLKQARKQYGEELDTILSDHATPDIPAPTKRLAPLVSQPSSRAAAERAFVGGESFDTPTEVNHATVGGNTVASAPRPQAQTPTIEQHHLVSGVHDTLDQLEAENVVNGETIDDHLSKAIGKTRRMLTTDTGVPGPGGESIKAPAVKVGDLLKVKKAVAKLADYGSPATPETRPYRVIEKSIAKEMETIDPRIAEMNKRYAGTMDQLEEANDILYGSQNPDLVRSTSKQKRARGLLGRVGDSTQAATLARDDIERLKALDPAYREALAPVEAKKAVERSRFGLPHVSRRIEHLPFALASQNLDALGARVADPLLSRIAGAAPRAAPSSGSISLINAARERQRQEADAAANFAGGL